MHTIVSTCSTRFGGTIKLRQYNFSGVLALICMPELSRRGSQHLGFLASKSKFITVVLKVRLKFLIFLLQLPKSVVHTVTINLSISKAYPFTSSVYTSMMSVPTSNRQHTIKMVKKPKLSHDQEIESVERDVVNDLLSTACSEASGKRQKLAIV